MNQPFALSLEQVDTINLSLSKVLAIARMVAECGTAARPVPGEEPPMASLFMVMQVVVDELEKVQEVMGALRKEGQTA